MSSTPNARVASASQTVGPFFHFGLTTDARLGQMIGPDTPGERMTLRIRVVDGAGSPLPDAMVELWQADASGAYAEQPDHSSAEPGHAFRGWGRLPTDDAGVCEFHTIRPGAPTAADGARPAAHINVCLFARGMLRHLFTRVYFEGDPMLEADPVLALVPAARRTTLLARVVDGVWTFEIRLQRGDETVFFDL